MFYLVAQGAASGSLGSEIPKPPSNSIGQSNHRPNPYYMEGRNNREVLMLRMP